MTTPERVIKASIHNIANIGSQFKKNIEKYQKNMRKYHLCLFFG